MAVHIASQHNYALSLPQQPWPQPRSSSHRAVQIQGRSGRFHLHYVLGRSIGISRKAASQSSYNQAMPGPCWSWTIMYATFFLLHTCFHLELSTHRLRATRDETHSAVEKRSCVSVHAFWSIGRHCWSSSSSADFWVAFSSSMQIIRAHTLMPHTHLKRWCIGEQSPKCQDGVNHCWMWFDHYYRCQDMFA